MIKINLLGEVSSRDTINIWYIWGYVISLVLLVILGIALYITTDNAFVETQSEIQVLEAQLKNLKERTKSVAELERKRAELTDKLRVISILRKSKSGPVRVLDDLNIAVPDRSWIGSIKESESVLRITGVSLDNQTIATFMKNLATSDYFEKVDLIESKEALKDGVKLKSFIIDAKISYAGKIAPVDSSTNQNEKK